MAIGHPKTFTEAIVLAARQEFRRHSESLIIAVTVQYAGKAFERLL